jgi:glucosamine-6-phosphate deaminase
MECIIRPTAESAAQLVAQIIGQKLRVRPNAVLGLATGRTMESVYTNLARMHRDEKLDFSQCRTFNLDEYVGLSGSDPHSYRYYMNKHLFSKVNVDLGNTHLPDGTADDLDAECEKYEQCIGRNGGIGLQLLGIGHDGHMGFNEPLSGFRSRTRVKALSPMTRSGNAALFSRPEDVPHRAITMGVGTILDSHRCLLLATGADKAEIVACAVEGPMTAMISATALQLHPHCVVVLDEAAAVRLKQKDYYRWIFDNEPEWKQFRSAK